MLILKIIKQPYNTFEEFQFMDVLYLDADGKEYEASLVEPNITEVLNAKLPYQLKKSIIQLKMFNDED
jgi:hypothetical protein